MLLSVFFSFSLAAVDELFIGNAYEFARIT